MSIEAAQRYRTMPREYPGPCRRRKMTTCLAAMIVAASGLKSRLSAGGNSRFRFCSSAPGIGLSPVLVMALVLSGCVNQPLPATASVSTPPLAAVVERQTVALAPVEVHVEAVGRLTEKGFAANQPWRGVFAGRGGNVTASMERAAEQRQRIEQQVAARVETELAEAGLTVRPHISPGTWGNLEAHRRQLTRRFSDKSDHASAIRRLGEVVGADAIAIADVLVRIGTSGGYEPVGGNIWAGTHSTTVTVTLVSTHTGEHIWARAAFVRKQPSEDDIRQLLDIVFEPSAKKD